jgi:epsilon-lactone hydrolase
VPPAPEEARRLLCTLGDHVRDLVVASRGMDLAAVAGETVADTSGGGCGGTVVVLSERGALDDVDTLIRGEAAQHAFERQGRDDMTDSKEPTVHLPSREIPAPSSLSPEARALMAVKLPQPAPYPALDDLEGWRSRVAEQEAVMRDLIVGRVEGAPVSVEEVEADGVPVYVITPDGTAEGDRRVFLSVHGGGFIGGAGVSCRAMGIGDALQMGVRTWALDYRMPPDHPYPAPLDDCVAVYRSMLQDSRPEEIVVGGASAGGNLAAALLLRARDVGLPLPAAAVLRTPEIDLTESGDSFQTNLGLDNLLTESLMPANLLYAAGHDLRDPYLSPLFADLTKGFPPTILITGTRDLFLSNTVLFHRALRAADIPAELHVLEAGGHGGFFGLAPEDTAVQRDVKGFVDRHWGLAV